MTCTGPGSVTATGTSPMHATFWPKKPVMGSLVQIKSDTHMAWMGGIPNLDWTDIQTEVSMLASQMALLREGHLEVIFRVFSYLKTKHNSWLVLDLSYPEINHSDFPDNDWTSMYGNVTEAILPDAPPPHGKEVDLHLYVDSNHAGDKYT